MSNYLGDQRIPLNLRKQVTDCALALAESSLALRLAPLSMFPLAEFAVERDELALGTAVNIATKAYLAGGAAKHIKIITCEFSKKSYQVHACERCDCRLICHGEEPTA